MNSCGIYTLANDHVYDQLVALLNSIEVNIGVDIPVCIIPFDHQLERVKKEISSRPNVSLFTDWDAIHRWENFAQDVIAAHPKAIATHFNHPRWYKGHLHRKFAAFDGEFDKFVFFDGDSLAMKPIDDIFGKLDRYDFVFDDWEHAKSKSKAALNIPLIEATGQFSEDGIRERLHCSSFFGSKRGLFDTATLTAMKERLINEQEISWVNGNGWWDDAFLFNYMTLSKNRTLFNFTRSKNGHERTGNCANADPFVAVEVLYNHQGLKPIHRIHYMGYAASDFKRLCQGEDAGICYQDTFLTYRFLKQPDKKPKLLKKQNLLKVALKHLRKIAKKITFKESGLRAKTNSLPSS